MGSDVATTCRALVLGAALLACRAGGSDDPQPAARDVSPAVPRAAESVSADSAAEIPPDVPRWPPHPPAAAERIKERREMVHSQIAAERFFRTPVTDDGVLEAMSLAPRHVFVPKHLQRSAYADTPLPIGYGQTISQPYIVAFMTELLDLEPGDRVLEIGTGSGYQAAVLAHLTPEVYTVEILEPLAERARGVFEEEGYAGIHTRHADGYYGWPEKAPFDAIIVTCAAGHLPPPLWEQLAPGGRIAVPIGGTHAVQRLVLMEKGDDGSRSSRSVMDVRFVPMTGRAQTQ